MGFFSSLFGGSKGKKVPKGAKRADLKRWDLRGRTGQGSMSKVFQAYDNALGRTVALKLLDKEKTKKFEARFVGLNKPSEGEITVALSHLNCVRTYEWGYLSGSGDPYLVMEWIEGLGLNYLIETKNAQLTGNRINYLSQLCDALQYMHDSKWLHRDLCPRNIMVDKDGVLKLIDFGLTIPYTPAFCAPGNRTGTPDYLAPELVSRRRTDHRVDLYALGVTAFELFTGGLPWERTPNSEENFRRRMNTAPRDPKVLNPVLQDDLVKVILKGIAKDANERFATARQMKEALEGLKKQDY